MPSVSVILPLYNKADYVLRSVGSVLGQTYRDFELIVVDDGSTDDSVAKLTSTYGNDTRLRVISQANAGVSAARNRGIEEMRTDLAAFLDADDEWMPEHLEHIVATAEAFPEAGLVGAGYRLLCPKGYVVEITVDAQKPTLITDYFRMAVRRHILTMSSCAVRRTVFEAVGRFAEGEPLGEDSEFYARGALNFAVAYAPRITAIYHNETLAGAMGSHSQDWQADGLLVARKLAEISQHAALPGLIPSLELYVARSLYEHIAFGIKVGSHVQAQALLDHPVLLKRIQGQAKCLKMALRYLPLRLIVMYFKLTRSRLRDLVSSKRDGVVVRVISAFDRS